MKTKNFLSIILAVLLCCGSCNGDRTEEKYPVLLGEQTLVGKIINVGMPSWDVDHPSNGAMVLGLETSNGNYMITINSQWIVADKIIFDGTEYFEGDEVEITGTVSVHLDQFSEEYFVLEIKTIKKEYPVILGEQSCIGKIIGDSNPCPPFDYDYPCVPGVVLWLETTSGNYVLSINSQWIFAEKIIFDGTEYFEGDEVEITGMVSIYLNQFSEEYFSLEIETIKKLP